MEIGKGVDGVEEASCPRIDWAVGDGPLTGSRLMVNDGGLVGLKMVDGLLAMLGYVGFELSTGF